MPKIQLKMIKINFQEKIIKKAGKDTGFFYVFGELEFQFIE